MFTYLDRCYSHLEIELCDVVSAAMTFRRIFFFLVWWGGGHHGFITEQKGHVCEGGVLTTLEL